MLCRDISLPVRRLSFGCSRCLLPLLAGTGGAVRGGEVGEWGVGLAVCCACILWNKGGAVSVEGNVCCLWGMLSVTAPCWSWWGKRR